MSSEHSDSNTSSDESLNQQAKRPSVTFTLPQKLVKRLNTIPKGEKSGFITEAIELHLADRDLRSEATTRIVAAANYLSETTESRTRELSSIAGVLEEISSQIAFQTALFEKIFGVAKERYEPFQIPENEFQQYINEAYAAYAASPELLHPNLESELDRNPLEEAARRERIRIRFEEAKILVESQPFMHDERLYCAKIATGWGVFDREFYGQAFVNMHEGTEHISREYEDFLVFSVSVINIDETISITFPETRPFFKLSRNDYRKSALVLVKNDVIFVMNMIVADYLAYRRFDTVRDGKKA
ncbi:hypothetical protein [Agrobacterium radiobacter]